MVLRWGWEALADPGCPQTRILCTQRGNPSSSNTAARLGHSGGGATTLRHYADPVPEVDRRAAAYLAQLTAGSATQSG